MENRKFVTTIKFAFAFVALLNFVSPTFSSRAYAYGIETHAGITREIVQFYNSSFPSKKIGETEMAQIVQGSRDEDDAPRWMNHFYDPVYNRGLTNFYGTDWMSSKQWANNRVEQLSSFYNPVTQTTLSTFLALTNPDALLMTDYTWQRSLEDYARGETARAFRGLGHVLHLLEDASVPDHTRNDPHPALEDSDYFETGSPYEIWTHRFTVDNINLLQYLYTKKPIALTSRDAYFDALANYSNKNFYSRDTIDIAEYKEPKPDYVLKSQGYNYGFRRDSDSGDYHLVSYKGDTQDIDLLKAKGEIGLQDDLGLVLRDYWERLAPKAVQYGAGLVELFLKEAEALKNDPNFVKEKPKSPLAQAVDAVLGLFGGDNEGVVPAGMEEVAVIPLAVSSSNPLGGQAQPAAGIVEARSENVALRQAQGINAEARRDATEAKRGEGGEQRSFAVAQDDKQKQVVSKEPEAATYRPNLAPPKPARFAGAVGLPAGAPMQPTAPVVTPCAYATGQTAASAQGSGEPRPSRDKLILNEIAWMGSVQNASDEWMELKNISGVPLDVSGWQVVDSGDQIHVTLPPETVIPAGGLYLLERTGDDTVPAIAADYIYVGTLGNKNDGVRLFDASCLLQDEVSGNPWPAGESGTKRTMERAPDLMWYTSSGTGPTGILGTPKMENSTRQAAQINLSRQALGSAPPISEPAPATPSSAAATHVVISEIQAGTDAGSDDEFIELYNPTNAEVSLTGWYLKKKTSSGAESSLVAAPRLDGKTIPAKGYLLLANEDGYKGSVVADVPWAKSNTIAYTNNAVVLYDASDAKVDEASWTEIAKNTSMERKAVENGACVAASGVGAYLGNACDSDTVSDFESRAAPQPQNRASLPEPRGGASVTNFQVSYDKATHRVAFVWDAAADARGATSSVRYVLYDVTGATTTLYSATGATSHVRQVSDVGRGYDYAIQATDAEGLAGDVGRASMTAASPFGALKFFMNPNAGTNEARIFLNYDTYPLFSGMAPWGALVFSLNADPVRQTALETPANWKPDDLTNVLTVRYRNYSNDWRTSASLILPIDASYVGSGGGLHNVAMRWDNIEAGKLMIAHTPPVKTFTTSDYLTVSFYDFGGSGGGNQWFQFAAADNTKYYFRDDAPVTTPPTAPTAPLVDGYDNSWRKSAIVSWNPTAADADGMDYAMTYQLNRATTSIERFSDEEWRAVGAIATSGGRVYNYYPAATGESYVFGVRAVDEFGYASTVATSAPYTVP